MMIFFSSDSGGAISIDVNGRRGVFGIVSFVAAVGCDLGFPEVKNLMLRIR
jgi:hypothetical protein